MLNKYEWSASTWSSYPRSTSGPEVVGLETEPQNFNFLSFLATAQALQIEFLPLTWQAARQPIGSGGTSRINQALVDLQTSFAFKRVHDDYKQNNVEAQIFQTLINEIISLGHPSIRENSNIAQLQGICWDVSPVDDKPWPVLVFEKTQFGDLYSFTNLREGRELGINERISLCVDIGLAIMDLHSINIIHGDIKPHNVLVFKNKSGKYHAKVIDFGYSTRYADDNHRIRLPRSWPWNAPEHDRDAREWTPSDAKKTDMFSFGLLCLWLLFEPYFSRVISLSHVPDWEAIDFPSSLEPRMNILVGLKIENELPLRARELLAAELALDHNRRATLESFFTSSLSGDLAQRNIRLQDFLSKLAPERMINRTRASEELDGKSSSKATDFKIQSSLYLLYACDYRVRQYITCCLIEEYHLTASTSLQVAICYHIGFGTTKDVAKSLDILGQNDSFDNTTNKVHSVEILEQNNDKTEIISDILANNLEYDILTRPSTLTKLLDIGRIEWTSFAEIYLEQGKLEEAEAVLSQEKEDLRSIFGAESVLFLTLNDMLSGIYNIQGRWEEAIDLREEAIEVRREVLGAEHPTTLDCIDDLAWFYSEQGRWIEAEKLELQVTEIREKNFGPEDRGTLFSMAALALIYNHIGKWEEAEKLGVQVLEIRQRVLGPEHPQTLVSMGNLALVYSNQRRWKEAEELEIKRLETMKRVLGAEHLSTLITMENLALTCSDQGLWKEAEDLGLQVMEIRKRVLGVEHHKTLLAMANLVSIFWDQQKWKEAEELGVQATEMSTRVLGIEHPTTLNSIGNLAETYSMQGRLEEAEELEVKVLEISKKVLGTEHPDTIVSMANLAVTWKGLGRDVEAVELMKECVQSQSHILGIDHHQTLATSSLLDVWQARS